ncbi:MAG: transposase [Candidatus Micrarchaeaceae archaeon]
MIVDVDTGTSIAVDLIPANPNDKKMFAPLYNKVKNGFVLQYGAKFLADRQHHSSKIYEQLRYDGITPVIPRSGNKYLKTIEPKDPDYGKRWAVERLFSRLKEMFGLAKNRFIGIKRVAIHVAFLQTCLNM